MALQQILISIFLFRHTFVNSYKLSVTSHNITNCHMTIIEMSGTGRADQRHLCETGSNMYKKSNCEVCGENTRLVGDGNFYCACPYYHYEFVAIIEENIGDPCTDSDKETAISCAVDKLWSTFYDQISCNCVTETIKKYGCSVQIKTCWKISRQEQDSKWEFHPNNFESWLTIPQYTYVGHHCCNESKASSISNAITDFEVHHQDQQIQCISKYPSESSSSDPSSSPSHSPSSYPSSSPNHSPSSDPSSSPSHSPTHDPIMSKLTIDRTIPTKKEKIGTGNCIFILIGSISIIGCLLVLILFLYKKVIHLRAIAYLGEAEGRMGSEEKETYFK